jgi:hypothetical protein
MGFILGYNSEGKRFFPDDVLGLAAFSCPFNFIQPNDGTGGAAFNRYWGGKSVPGVINPREIVLDMYEASRGILGALFTASACNLTLSLCLLVTQQILAGHPQSMSDWLNGKQVLWADLHAIFTGGAFAGIDDRKTVLIHADGIELTHILTISKPQATPGTTLGTTANQGCCVAGFQTVIVRTLTGDMSTTGTGQASHPLHHITGVYSQIFGYLVYLIAGTDGAVGGRQLTADERFGEWTTASRTTCATIGFWQQILYFIYTGIFVDPQLMAGEGKDSR